MTAMKKLFAVLLACALLVVALPTSADAYVTKLDEAKGWWGDDTIDFSFDSTMNNSQYNIYMSDWSAAMRDWNCTEIPLTYTYSSDSDATVLLGVVYLSETTTYGVTNCYFRGGDYTHVIRYADSFINLSPPDIDNSKVARSAAAHEIGHLNGLLHENDEAKTDSLMYVQRNRSTCYSPDDDSIDGVNFFYRGWDFDTWQRRP